MTRDELVKALAEAIARFEGFFKKNSLAKRNNNPGNLRSWGRVRTVGGFAVFDTVEDGWAALKIQIQKNVFIRRLTFREFFAGKKGVYPGYAPAHENDSNGYAKFVAKCVGCDDIDKVIELLVKEPDGKENSGKAPKSET